MQAITTIGLDIAKSVFQVHGVNAEGKVVFRRQSNGRYVLSFFQKLPPCLVGIEACATSHYWSRELQAVGHRVKLRPPAYVKPYVSGRRTMPLTQRQSARPLAGRTCGSWETKTPEQQARRTRIACGFLSRRCCTASSTSSCSHRVIRRSGPFPCSAPLGGSSSMPSSTSDAGALPSSSFVYL
jgi:hypothetical protein